MPAALVVALAVAMVGDGQWAASLAAGDVRLPAGHYRGPWTLARGVHLTADPGSVLEGGDPVVAVTGDDVVIRGLAIHATGVGVSIRRARGFVLEHASVSGGTQSIYFAEAEGRVADTALSRSDYGVLTWKARVELKNVHAAGIRRAGAGLVRSRGLVEGCVFTGPFQEAAVSVVGSPSVVLRRNRVRDAGAIGLKLVSSTGELAGNRVAGARSDPRGLEGDDVYLFDSTVHSSGDELADATGDGLTVLGGRAHVAGCRISGVSQAAVYVGEQAHAEIQRCSIDRAGAGLVVEPGAAGLAKDTQFLHMGADAGP